MSPLVQQGRHVIVNRQRAAASKRGIQLAVGVEPGNAAEIRPTVGKLKAADHDLSVRLHSRACGVLFAMVPKGNGVSAKVASRMPVSLKRDTCTSVWWLFSPPVLRG
jgi:hypothetical protein